ncbi:hypothetical protein Cgig2_025810 [Carnegiea gigantea]|uniref:Uncharacterized protein n=1 Tax=Carnegiea gigantea TaxID=171969 RepID=A0A9Q1GHV2_9CARY|nr:hypothetical protein Cgig2_025810 [Carnegiea gigantea]
MTGSKVPSPHNAKEPAKQSKQALQPVEQKKGSPRAYDEQEATDSRKPKLTKEVVPKKNNEKHLGAARTPEKLKEASPLDALKKRQTKKLPLAYCSPYVIRLTKLDGELSQEELTISEHVFRKVKDVDDNESLFDGCSDKEAIRDSMVTLKLGD